MFADSPAGTLSPDLDPVREGTLGAPERLKTLKAYLATEEKRIQGLHKDGAGGVEVASQRARMIDEVLDALFTAAIKKAGKTQKLALIANGGYGRGLLNPGSDLDILFLLPCPARRLPADLKSTIDEVLYPLWDLGFKLGHASRSVPECIAEGKSDSHTRTTLFDSRYLCGDRALATDLHKRFRRDCIEKNIKEFFKDREDDLKARYAKYSSTVYLQEPNIKESPGGLRDYHNLLWLSDALFSTRDLGELQDSGVLSEKARDELVEAFDFMHRIRNDLHYRSGKGNDILTLRLQGLVARSLRYPQKTVLRRIEALMRDYYLHARHIHQHTQSVFEIAFLGWAIPEKPSLKQLLRPTRQEQDFGEFTGRSERLFAKSPDVFTKDPSQLLSLFRLCQEHNLSPSPDLRKLIKASVPLIDHAFRMNAAHREIFRDILEHKGEVGRTLRLMHRVGVLGRYLPEFGQLDCLVQHEFFHRYTADEHTLRCIDHLDALLDSSDPSEQRFRKLLIDHEDPYALYLAIIMHDTGRSEDVREHSDGSAYLADRVCRRMGITGDRRKLLMFLVVHHLSFWLYATKRDLSDPDTITEFAGIVKNKHWLDSLLLFTYVDSRGTSESSWTPWKETLILQLYHLTRNFLLRGEAEVDAEFRRNLVELREQVESQLAEKYQGLTKEHFDLMPKRYFRFRSAHEVSTHIRAIWQYFDRRNRRDETPFEAAVQWIEHPKRGYTELLVVTENTPMLLEKICCALASCEINILSADIFTRPDGLVLDFFRVCTVDQEAVTDEITQIMATQKLYHIHLMEKFDPAPHLKPKDNYLRETLEGAIPFPVRAYVDPEADPNFTVIEVQAIDRIGLLHDLFQVLNRHNIQTVHSRISTEKGAALDSFYILDQEGHKVTDEATLETLAREINAIIGVSDNEVTTDDQDQPFPEQASDA